MNNRKKTDIKMQSLKNKDCFHNDIVCNNLFNYDKNQLLQFLQVYSFSLVQQ